jgi:NADPH-dependent 2,4-dienoyl-CoA reductase/sulfur reductase-like enzyme/rhodanese-related sulfurtransferase
MARILIVGGVAGGASVAARVRRLDENAEIIMFEKGENVSFSNCALPFYLSREVPTSEKLVMVSPAAFKAKFNIEARVNTEVVDILANENKIVVKDLLTGTLKEEYYDKLYLSPGEKPIVPETIKGVHSKNVFTVRNVKDIKALDEYITENNVNNITVVGGGFIGVEIMENLVKAGKKVTMIEASDQVMNTFDNDMAQIIQKEIVDNGVHLGVQQKVEEITEDSVILASGIKIKTEGVVMAVGCEPETSLAKRAGIELGVTGCIKVDSNYKTNFKDIYAVGDAIEVINSLTNKPMRLALAGPAQREARAASDAAYGREVTNKGVIGSCCTRVFNLNTAKTGLTVKDCLKAEIKHDYVYTISPERVSIIPGAKGMHFKLIFEVPSGRILGAQAIGGGNVDKRIDVIATLISMGGNLKDLRELELCYSPMFSTARDITNVAGLVGLNILNEEFKQVHVDEVRDLVLSNAYIIDVREKAELEGGKLINSVNIPMSEYRSRIDEIPKDRPVYVHCKSSKRSYNVVRTLNNLGYSNVYNISGSFLGICLNQYFEDLRTGRKRIVTNYNFK